MMFQGDFCGILNLQRRAAHDRRQPRRSHRCCRANLSLASHFGAGDRGIFLEQNGHCRRGEKELHDPVVVSAAVSAGTNCGSCNPELAALLASATTAKAAAE